MTGANTSTQSETSCPCWLAAANGRPVELLEGLVSNCRPAAVRTAAAVAR